MTSVFDANFQNGAASRSNQESLRAICAFWSKIWERDKPLPENAFQFWCQGIPEGERLAWSDLPKEELHAQAAKQRDSAGGCDGFHGSEIADWPLHAWHVFAMLLARWQERCELPSCWSNIKQVHLQKPDAKLRAADAAIAAKDMRPISIQSVLWRVTASAWTKRESTRAWINSWVHPTAFGGLRGHSVGQAVDTLLQAFQSPDAILVSLDFQKCFDCVDPALGIRCLEHMGCPTQVLSMLKVIWNQTRWLTWKGEFLAHAVPVCSSMPQGDALSPLTLIAIISGLTTKVFNTEYPLGHTLVTYLDDRNFVTKSAAHAARLWCLWQELSAKVGLWENKDKVKVIPRRASQKQLLLNSGFSETHVATSARVLGVDFNGRLGGANRETQDARRQAAAARISRIALLPVTVQQKARLIASLAIPKAIWGAWLSLHPLKNIISLVKRTAGGLHRSASPHLFFLLSGHGLHPWFCAGIQSFCTFAQLVRENPRPWPAQAKRGTWLKAVCGFLHDLRWRPVEAWTWKHHDFPSHTISFSMPLPAAELEQEKHVLRESWRRIQLASFLTSGRRDATSVGPAVYSEDRMTKVRKHFQQLDVHARAVMVGAVVSDARFDRVRGLEIQKCQWCDSEAVPSWEHLTWFCKGFEATRCAFPSDSLQRVLGWPCGQQKDFDNAVLAHMGSVRSRILDRRYRS